jgi:hypothetical protein
MNDYLSILSTTLGRWQSLAEYVPADLLRRRPAPAEWSALECLLHLIDTERFVFPVRVRAFLNEQDLQAFDPETQGAKLEEHTSPAGLVQKFSVLRRESLALLATLTPADLSLTARHSELGLVTLEQMLNEWAAHELDHTIQAERALMQPFIDACGPWQGYFQANRINR